MLNILVRIVFDRKGYNLSKNGDRPPKPRPAGGAPAAAALATPIDAGRRTWCASTLFPFVSLFVYFALLCSSFSGSLFDMY
jgi:hypothetical protein